MWKLRADFRYRTPFSAVGDAEVYIQMVMLSNEIAGRWFFDRGVTSTGLRAGRTRWCCFCNGPFQDGTLGGISVSGGTPSVQAVLLVFEQLVDFLYQFQQLLRILLVCCLFTQTLPTFLDRALHHRNNLPGANSAA